jgi:LysM repeat protein
MKYLLLSSFLLIFACVDGTKEYKLPVESFSDSLELGVDVLPQKVRTFSITPAEISGTACSSSTMTIVLTIENDTITDYTISSKCGHMNVGISPVHFVKAGDTKTKIAARLKVPVSKILNNEPLQIGEKIKLGNGN